VVEESDAGLEIKTKDAEDNEDEAKLVLDGDTLTLTEAAEAEGEEPTVMTFKKK